MAKMAEHPEVSARLIAMCEAAGLNPNEVASCELVHAPLPARLGDGPVTRVRFELYLTDAMAAALLGDGPASGNDQGMAGTDS